MKVMPLRLQPGDDLRRKLEAWMGEQQEQAGCVISGVGSLSVAQPRFAGATEDMAIHGALEILSLSGTLSPDGAHFHIAVADSAVWQGLEKADQIRCSSRVFKLRNQEVRSEMVEQNRTLKPTSTAAGTLPMNPGATLGGAAEGDLPILSGRE